jgi:peptide/nickel transport system ATP-binding protein/glutathione transport system ATP-binding protein
LGADALVSIEDLRVEFPTNDDVVVGVDGVSFSIKRGQTVCVVGESGSGKSVTALSLMRLVEFGGGNIKGGQLNFKQNGDKKIDLRNLDMDEMCDVRGNDIGMIFQEPMTSLNPVFTVGKQLSEALIVHKDLTQAEANAQATELLRKVLIPEPERRLQQYPHELSGGMRQRVMIAMAIACKPRLLIADEPTTALDVTTQAEILGLIRELKEDIGTAVMFVTHDMGVVAEMADHVVVMYRGKKVEEGPVEQIFANPQHEYTKALLSAVPRLGAMKGTKGPTPLKILGDDSETSTSEIKAKKPDNEIILKVENLVTRFPVKKGLLRRTVARVHAVEDVSFELKAGETLGIVGESGCGKSTAGRSILRLTEPTSGSVIIDGQDVLAMSQEKLQAARQNMQMIFQDPYAALNPKITVFNQVAEPLRNFNVASGQELRDRVKNLFERVGLDESHLNRYPHEFSGGQRQRICIARALALSPKLIIADESVSALDVSVQAQVINLMLELQQEMGLSYIFISHDMAVVERVSHKVAVMYLGRIVEMGTRADVFENPQHAYTKKLLEAVPIPDPTKRKERKPSQSSVIPSPIYPADYAPEPTRYERVGDDHIVAINA